MADKGTQKHTYLDGGNSNIFLCSPLKIGEMIQFDEHIFQMGWFNHQPDTILLRSGKEYNKRTWLQRFRFYFHWGMMTCPPLNW